MRHDEECIDGGRAEDKGGECIDCGRPAVHALAQAGRCAPCWAQYVAGREEHRMIHGTVDCARCGRAVDTYYVIVHPTDREQDHHLCLLCAEGG